jgi:transcriptional regulator with XRE-family HTH domain
MKNNLKTMRKVKHLTQGEVASFIGANQSTYSYWENGQVKVDNQTYVRLAEYYGVSVDFLAGRSYILTLPVEQWDKSLQDDYDRADEYEKKYLEFKYGHPDFSDSICKPITPYIMLYRQNGQMLKKSLTDDQANALEIILKSMS